MPTGDPPIFVPGPFVFVPKGPDVDVPPAIAALMAELPKPGEAWPVAKRDRWLNALGAVLDYIYPERAASSAGDSRE